MTTKPFWTGKLTSKPGLNAGLDNFSLSRHFDLLLLVAVMEGKDEG